jgi:hypothetical protein
MKAFLFKDEVRNETGLALLDTSNFTLRTSFSALVSLKPNPFRFHRRNSEERSA